MKKILEYLLESLRSDCGILESTFCAIHLTTTTLYGSVAATHFSDLVEYRNHRFYLKDSIGVEQIILELESR